MEDIWGHCPFPESGLWKVFIDDLLVRAVVFIVRCVCVESVCVCVCGGGAFDENLSSAIIRVPQTHRGIAQNWLMLSFNMYAFLYDKRTLVIKTVSFLPDIPKW